MKTRKYSIWILLSLLIITLFYKNCLAVRHSRFHSDKNGYSIAIPDGWVEIPRPVILEAYEQLYSKKFKTETTRSSLDTGFQLDSGGDWFRYPYVIIQTIKYSDNGLKRQIFEDEMDDFVSAFTGLSTTKFLRKAFSTEMKELVSELKIGKIYVDRRNGVYALATEMTPETKGIIVGHFGSQSLIQVAFFDLKSNWSKSNPDRNLILESFQFDPTMTYNEAYRNKPGILNLLSSRVSKVVSAALFSGIILLVIGIYIYRRFQYRHKPSQNAVINQVNTATWKIIKSIGMVAFTIGCVIVVMYLMGEKLAQKGEKVLITVAGFTIFTELAAIWKPQKSTDEDETKEAKNELEKNCQPKSKKVSINCPKCGRSLEGATQEMIGDTGICPKCKAEFIIE
jgi:predicted Zn-ribbon and HTH transcriptional regulator